MVRRRRTACRYGSSQARMRVGQRKSRNTRQSRMSSSRGLIPVPKPSKQRPNKLDKFLSNLNGIIDALPSESEKQEVESGFLKLIGFLTDLKTRFELVPSAEEAANLRLIV